MLSFPNELMKSLHFFTKVKFNISFICSKSKNPNPKIRSPGGHARQHARNFKNVNLLHLYEKNYQQKRLGGVQTCRNTFWTATMCNIKHLDRLKINLGSPKHVFWAKSHLKQSKMRGNDCLAQHIKINEDKMLQIPLALD